MIWLTLNHRCLLALILSRGPLHLCFQGHRKGTYLAPLTSWRLSDFRLKTTFVQTCFCQRVCRFCFLLRSLTASVVVLASPLYRHLHLLRGAWSIVESPKADFHPGSWTCLSLQSMTVKRIECFSDSSFSWSWSCEQLFLSYSPLPMVFLVFSMVLLSTDDLINFEPLNYLRVNFGFYGCALIFHLATSSGR